METIYYEMDIIPSHVSVREYLDYNTVIVLRAIYETLFTVTEQGQLLFNGMEYTWNEEKNKLIIRLNAEKRWSDGSIVKAGHYVNQFLFLMEKGRIHPLYKFLCYIKNWDACIDHIVSTDEIGIKALDNFTLVFELESPVPFFEEVLSNIYTVPFKQEGIFNGSYIVEKITENHIILIRNNYYLCKESKLIEKIVFKKNSDYQRIVKDFLEGRCQITGNTQFPHDRIATIKENYNLVINNNSNLFFILRFNIEKEIINQIKSILKERLYRSSTGKDNLELWKIGNTKNPLFKERWITEDKTKVVKHTNKKVKILYSDFYPNEKVVDILCRSLSELFIVEKKQVQYEAISRNEIVLENNELLLDIISFECYSFLSRLITLLPCINEERVNEYIEGLEQLACSEIDEKACQKCLHILEDSKELFILFELNSYQLIYPNMDGFYIQNGQASFKDLRMK